MSGDVACAFPLASVATQFEEYRTFISELAQYPLKGRRIEVSQLRSTITALLDRAVTATSGAGAVTPDVAYFSAFRACFMLAECREALLAGRLAPSNKVPAEDLSPDAPHVLLYCESIDGTRDALLQWARAATRRGMDVVTALKDENSGALYAHFQAQHAALQKREATRQATVERQLQGTLQDVDAIGRRGEAAAVALNDRLGNQPAGDGVQAVLQLLERSPVDNSGPAGANAASVGTMTQAQLYELERQRLREADEQAAKGLFATHTTPNLANGQPPKLGLFDAGFMASLGPPQPPLMPASPAPTVGPPLPLPATTPPALYPVSAPASTPATAAAASALLNFSLRPVAPALEARPQPASATLVEAKRVIAQVAAMPPPPQPAPSVLPPVAAPPTVQAPTALQPQRPGVTSAPAGASAAAATWLVLRPFKALSPTAAWRYPAGSAGAATAPARGLINMGNTCYMNSTLQCLYSTPLRAAVLRSNFEVSSGAPVLDSLGLLFREMMRPRLTTPAAAGALKRAVGAQRAPFATFQQQDAAEFVAAMLDVALEEETRRLCAAAAPAPASVNSVGGTLITLAVAPASSAGSRGSIAVEAAADVDNCDSTQSDRTLAAHHWAQYLVGMCRATLGSGALPQLSVALSRARRVADGGSLVTRHFAFQLRRATICKECGETARKFDVAYTLDVPIPSANNGGAVALGECLRAYLGVEHTPQRDAFYTCRRCGNAKRASVQQLALYSTPPVLVVTLKRFDAYGTKVETPVVFPQELDLAPYMAAPANGSPSGVGVAAGAEHAVAGDPLGGASSRMYRLCGHVSHQGTLSGGHYTATTCDVASGSSQWTYYSDDRVKPVAGATADFAFAYSLYYVRV